MKELAYLKLKPKLKLKQKIILLKTFYFIHLIVLVFDSNCNVHFSYVHHFTLLSKLLIVVFLLHFFSKRFFKTSFGLHILFSELLADLDFWWPFLASILVKTRSTFTWSTTSVIATSSSFKISSSVCTPCSWRSPSSGLKLWQPGFSLVLLQYYKSLTKLSPEVITSSYIGFTKVPLFQRVSKSYYSINVSECIGLPVPLNKISQIYVMVNSLRLNSESNQYWNYV